jgi:hypothetical protein
MKYISLYRKYLIVETILLLLSSVFNSCDHLFDKEYKKFQTFNEYKLQGIDNSGESTNIPYVYVKTTKDTILVSTILNIGKNKKLTYIQRGSYWFCREVKHEDARPNTKSETVDYYCDKYIFNDTILKLKYFIIPLNNPSKKLSNTLYIETQKNQIEITIKDTTYQFEDLRSIARNYREKIPYENTKDDYQPEYYKAYRKEIKKDFINYYEENPLLTREPVKTNSLNSLGEFGLRD